MVSTVYEYEIYCQTDSKWVTGYGVTPPSQCYDDSSHEFVPNSVRVTKTISNTTIIASDSSPVSGRFQVDSIEIDIPPNPTGTQIVTTNLSFAFNMYLWQLSVSNSNNIGDHISMSVSPDTPVGYTLSPTVSGTNVIMVSDTVLENVTRGSDVGLLSTDISGNPIKEYPGRVILVDKINKTITMEKNLVHSYTGIESGVPTTTVLLTIFPIRKLTIDSTQRLVIGTKGLNTRYIPADSNICITYYNNITSTESFKVYLTMEYYYN
jgi:hypothetical protein